MSNQQFQRLFHKILKLMIIKSNKLFNKHHLLLFLNKINKTQLIQLKLNKRNAHKETINILKNMIQTEHIDQRMLAIDKEIGTEDINHIKELKRNTIDLNIKKRRLKKKIEEVIHL